MPSTPSIEEILDQHGSYASFGKFLWALIKANKVSVSQFSRDIGANRVSVGKWLDDEFLPELSMIEPVIKNNPLKFPVDGKGEVLDRYQKIFLAKAKWHAFPEQVQADVRTVLEEHEKYPEFHQFFEALCNTNALLARSSGPLALATGLSVDYIYGVRAGTRKVGRDFLERLLGAESNPLSLPLENSKVAKAVKELFYQKAGLPMVTPELIARHRSEVLEKLHQGQYHRAGEFFKDFFASDDYKTIAHDLAPHRMQVGKHPKLDEHYIASIFNGHKNIGAEVEAFCSLARIGIETAAHTEVAKLDVDIVKPYAEFGKQLRALMGEYVWSGQTFYNTLDVRSKSHDFPDIKKSEKGINSSELAQMAKHHAEGFQNFPPFTENSLDGCLAGRHKPDLPMARAVYRCLKTGLAGDREKLEVLSKLMRSIDYDPQTLLSEPKDILTAITPQDTIEGVVKKLRQTEQINMSSDDMVRVLNLHARHNFYDLENKKYGGYTPSHIQTIVDAFNEKLASLQLPLIDEAQQKTLMDLENTKPVAWLKRMQNRDSKPPATRHP